MSVLEMYASPRFLGVMIANPERKKKKKSSYESRYTPFVSNIQRFSFFGGFLGRCERESRAHGGEEGSIHPTRMKEKEF